MSPDPTVELVGRRSSHFTRVAAIFAHELGVPVVPVVVHDLTNLDPAIYGGHPALKIPLLRVGTSTLVGTENICRRLAELADGDARIAWPEQVTDDVGRNAQELTWHAMSAQVQLVIGTVIAKLPADNVYFAKGRAGLEGALRWLDAHVALALDALPRPRDLSLLEVTLFCLVEHLRFRPTVPLDPYPDLLGFVTAFGARASARATTYAFDPQPRA